ncbi:Guanine nucleotide exchange protein smcr8 [Linnemannia zychae]|nr:Guanine nucleotide exchange protein smcr8 [Linnemannia zychae]
MFNWTAFPETIDNNYDDLDTSPMASSPPIVSSLPTVSTTTQQSPQQSLPTPAQLLPRSASTSQIDPTSPTPHFETATTSQFPVSTGSRLHQRTPGVGSLSEASSPMMGVASRHLTTKSATLDSINYGLKGPGPLDSPSLGLKSQQQKEQQKSVLATEPSTGCWWLTKKSTNLPDFVLISEFSELEGPRAVMTIPDNIVDLTRDSYSSHKQRVQESTGKHSHDHSDTSNSTLGPNGNSNQDNDNEDLFDVHEFVLRITSVDQQQRESSGGFHIPEDIEVHVSDVEKGYWAYVHHFTLFDINARGFVRPFCMSYITRDPHKILPQYEEMRHKFRRAALYFKTGNYTLFRQDLTKRLRDLNYTKNLLLEAPSETPGCSEASNSSHSKDTLTSGESLNTLTPSSPDLSELTKKSEIGPGLTEQQRDDLASIKDAIEQATHIISTLEQYSVDGQPLLGYADNGHDGQPPMAPLSALSPMNSSENLAMLAAGRVGAGESPLYLGVAPRSGPRIRHKNSTSSVLEVPSRILDTSTSMIENHSAPMPLLLGLQQEQSRKNSVVSDYDSMLYETPEYEAQYVTTLYPIFRDEVVFRPLRELCVATMVWNSSIQFHLGIKKIKDIIKEFQADASFLGLAADNLKRMHPTSAALTIGQKFMINFRNPEFNRATARLIQPQESSAPLVELLQGMTLENVNSEDGFATQDMLLSQASQPSIPPQYSQTPGELRPGLPTYADDADDEQTGYDSLDDAASFFTAITGMATHTDTPTREAFVVTPLDRSARVVEWHQEQQNLHHAKGAPPHPEYIGEHAPWTFGAGLPQGETPNGGSLGRFNHRYSGQSGASMGLAGTAVIPATSCPTIVLDTLQKDLNLAKHLVFALLSGQKVCVIGSSEIEQKVRSMVTVLATFLPHPGYPTREEQLMEQQRRIIPWYQGYGLLQVEDMQTLYIVGVDSSKIDPKFMESDICVVDCDTLTWVNGRQYTDGILLESIFRNMTLFSEDASFMAFVEGKFFDILLKAFLYYHLVFQGRLYQGVSFASIGGHSFYSSGMSDDGEAYSYQSNFRSARPSPITSRNNGLYRGSRKGTSSYVSSTSLGTTLLNKHPGLVSEALSSHDSSDVEMSFPGNGYSRKGFKRDSADSHFYERGGRNQQRKRPEFSGDESSQSGGPSHYTTSQGMRKWKKWFDYWSAKSAAMIDPALAAFGRSDSNNHVDGASGVSGRRKRISSGLSSPRRSRNPSSHHTSPGRNRDTREREKERDRERDRERNRKGTFEAYEISKENVARYSSDSDTLEQRDSSEKPSVNHEVDRVEFLGDQVDDINGTQSIVAENDGAPAGSHDSNSTVTKSSNALRKLKPKRPLSLHRHLSHFSDHEHKSPERGDGGLKTKSDISANSPSISPSASATFRSIAGTFRAMSFGRAVPSTIVSGPTSPLPETTNHLDTLTTSAGRLSIDTQRSSRNSREYSDSNQHKDIKRRGTTRAKAKAWFKSKRKRRSRIYDGDEATGNHDDQTGHLRDLDEDDQDSTSDDLNEDHGNEDVPCPSLPSDQHPKALITAQSSQSSSNFAPATSSSTPTKRIILPIQSQTSVDNTNATKEFAPPDGPLDIPLTLEEIAAQEPTRIVSRPVSAPAITTTLNNSTSSSRVSSASVSRITSPTFIPPALTHHHRRLESISGSRLPLKGLGLNNGSAVASELDDSEYDRRRDLGRESATEYETSLETFGSMDIGSPGFMHRRGSISGRYPAHRQSMDSLGRRSLDSPTVASVIGTVTNQAPSSLTEKAKLESAKLKETEKSSVVKEKENDTVTLTEEEETIVRDMVGGVSGDDDWSIIVYLATMVDEYERSRDPKTPVSGEP